MKRLALMLVVTVLGLTILSPISYAQFWRTPIEIIRDWFKLTRCSISGRVIGTDQVTVNLSGARTWTITTGTQEGYSFGDLPAGHYTITPVKRGYKFVPETREVTIGDSNISDQNFTAIADVSGSWSGEFWGIGSHGHLRVDADQVGDKISGNITFLNTERAYFKDGQVLHFEGTVQKNELAFGHTFAEKNIKLNFAGKVTVDSEGTRINREDATFTISQFYDYGSMVLEWGNWTLTKDLDL